MITHYIFIDDHEGTRHVVRLEPRSWQWCPTLSKCLAHAELQQAHRVELLAKVEQANARQAQQVERKKAEPPRLTAGDHLLAALDLYIDQRIPEPV